MCQENDLFNSQEDCCFLACLNIQKVLQYFTGTLTKPLIQLLLGEILAQTSCWMRCCEKTVKISAVLPHKILSCQVAWMAEDFGDQPWDIIEKIVEPWTVSKLKFYISTNDIKKFSLAWLKTTVFIFLKEKNMILGENIVLE